MKYYIIAGEASGDLHGSNLIKALKRKDPNARFRCWGGDLMEDAGAELVGEDFDVDLSPTALQKDTLLNLVAPVG